MDNNTGFALQLILQTLGFKKKKKKSLLASHLNLPVNREDYSKLEKLQCAHQRPHP